MKVVIVERRITVPSPGSADLVRCPAEGLESAGSGAAEPVRVSAAREIGLLHDASNPSRNRARLHGRKRGVLSVDLLEEWTPYVPPLCSLAGITLDRADSAEHLGVRAQENVARARAIDRRRSLCGTGLIVRHGDGDPRLVGINDDMSSLNTCDIGTSGEKIDRTEDDGAVPQLGS